MKQEPEEAKEEEPVAEREEGFQHFMDFLIMKTKQGKKKIKKGVGKFTNLVHKQNPLK